jgi:hypothetical protein
MEKTKEKKDNNEREKGKGEENNMRKRSLVPGALVLKFSLNNTCWCT